MQGHSLIYSQHETPIQALRLLSSIKQNNYILQEIIGSLDYNVMKGYPQKVYLTYMKLIALCFLKKWRLKLSF